MDLDVGLDEIIKKKGSKRGRGGRGRGAGRGEKRTVSSSDPRGRYAGAAPAANHRQQTTVIAASPAAALPGDGTKIVVSGLPDDVNEPMVKDLFQQTVGPIKTISMAYNSQGRPTGTATIEFKRAGDGAKAYADYNGRLIDQSSW